MKRKIARFLVLTCGVVLLSGCSFSREEESTEEVIEDTSEQISVVIENDKSLLDMTRDELNALTPAEIKQMVETQLPNYREIYLIEEDREMSDADWIQLRDIMVLQLFGPEEVDTEVKVDTDTIPEAENDPNAIYYAPTKEYLDSMSTEEFAEYLNGMYRYMSGDDADPNMDFSTLDEETLLKQKKDLYDTLGFSEEASTEE